MPALIRYDASSMFRLPIGLRERQALDDAKRSILGDRTSGTQGWLGCPDDKDLVSKIKKLAQEKKKFKTCLVIGIGGSDLGARAVWHAMKDRANGMRLEFAGATTDPDDLAATLSRLDLKSTLVNIISKSGDTVEPMSAFFVLRDMLIKAVGKKRSAGHIVATTDDASGSLRQLADEEGYATLPVPQNIGGRFSVLTAVGLFPLACAGVNISKMLSGAKRIRDEFVSGSPTQNDACRYAALHVHGDLHQKHPIHVLMPYSARLTLFAAWYRQLWAESLGKDGKGPTPVAAHGPADQHSQLQLYQDGPKDKIVTFIDVDSFASKLNVPNSAKKIPALSYLAGTSFQDIIHAERTATAQVLSQNGRPNGTLSIPRVDEASLGALFMHFQIATAVAGSLYGINAYDQPGVEASKQAMRALLQ